MMRFGEMLNRETIKPLNLGETLTRLVGYFRRFWYMILLAVGFVVVATWTQVTTPELMGQATDCFLVPTGASAFESFGSFGADSGSQSNTQASNCWLTTDEPSSLTFTRRLIYDAFHAGGYEFPANATTDDRIAGLLRLIIILVAFYIAGAVFTGATFFVMAWTGQHVLRALRLEVFEKLHELSLSYYAEHEAQPETFSSIPASMWWAIVTLTTVGYGDTVPMTAAGRVLAALTAVLGIAMLALPTAILTSGLMEKMAELRKAKAGASTAGAPATCPHCGRELHA